MKNSRAIILILGIVFLSACRIKEKERKGPLHIVATTGNY